MTKKNSNKAPRRKKATRKKQKKQDGALNNFNFEDLILKNVR